MRYNVILKAPTSIPAYSNIAIPINNINLPARNDFIFKPTLDYPIALFILLVNSSFYAVIARNNLKYLVYLPRKLHISTIIDLDVDGYYYLDNPDV